jgi:hypothetical protein
MPTNPDKAPSNLPPWGSPWKDGPFGKKKGGKGKGGKGGKTPIPSIKRGPKPGYGELRIDAPDFTMRLRQHDAMPTPSFGGGWGVAARPKEKGIPDWTGGDPRREVVSAILDEYAQGAAGVERRIMRLETLTEIEEDGWHPPVIQVRGGIHLAGKKVVLENLELVEPHIRKRRDDRRSRQGIVLHLLEYQTPDQIRVKKKPKRPKRYKTKGRVSVRRVAAILKPNAGGKEQAAYARRIARLNKIRDVRRKLKPGTVLKLP